MRNESANTTRIFTDGACSGNPGPGGWAAIVCSNNSIVKLSGGCDNSTNNRMELLGVVNGLTYAKRNGHRWVEIHSDSAYVVNAITKGWIYSWSSKDWIKSNGEPVKNSDLWESVLKLITDNCFEFIKFNKVKGHSGQSMNEMADECARAEIKLREQ